MSAAPILRAVGLTKSFGPVRANEAVSLEIFPGELLCLFGENGAGKSTLSAMLYGELRPDAGHLEIRGEKVEFRSPADAIMAGIGMVHQHFVLAGALTVLENIVAGTQRKGWRLDLAAARARLAAMGGELGISVDLDRPVWRLSVGEQQWVEILKALYLGVEILILDEPTAVLTPQESDQLFRLIGVMRRQGLAVIIVTHKLREVMQADRITVLRRGRNMGTLSQAEASPEILTGLMIGAAAAPVAAAAGAAAAGARPPGRVIVQAEKLVSRGFGGEILVDDVSLLVRAGEILGIAGVAGNGQKPLLEMLAGIRRPDRGVITIDGETLSGRGPAAFMRAGVGIIPEDRYAEGLVGEFSIADNLILGQQRGRQFGRGMFIARDKVAATARAAMQRYAIAAPGIDTEVRRLSGGNAQKVVLARELAQASVLLLANQPTRGLDVGVVASVHAELRAKREAGVAVILVSEDLDDLFALSDRIAVMFAGRIVDILDPVAASRERVGGMMAGGAARGDAAREALSCAS
jgi:simple sugar transport system ATP-binding protein